MASPSVSEFLSRKVPVPSEMLTRDWDRVELATRERAFFMASVTQAEILDAYKFSAEEVAAGRLNSARAAEITRERLIQLGYKPAPGTEGGIKDLTSWRRLKVTIETNVAMAQGWAGYERQVRAALVFPGKRMVRLVNKREPRNWPQRWRMAAGSVPAQGLNVGDMSAHIFHPVWRRISRFNAPYPLYDFGSGMGDKQLKKAESETLGIAKPPPAGPVDTPADVPGSGVITPGLNETLEATPEVRSKAVKRSLEEQLGGTAKWEGEKLVYLDPNGTRPDTAEQLAKIVGKRTFPGAPTYQLEAAQQYASEGPDRFSRGSDALYDLARLVHRTQPMERPPVLWHGRTFEDDFQREVWLEALAAGEPILPLPGWPFMALDTAAEVALAQLEGGSARGVVISIRGAVSARDLRPTLNTLTTGGDPQPGIFMEAGRRLRILKTTRDSRGVVHLICEEITEDPAK